MLTEMFKKSNAYGGCCSEEVGMGAILRSFMARGCVTIVNYHDPSPDIFERHISAFKKIYNFISLDRLATAMTNKDVPKLPRRSMVVTFDDGYVGNIALLPTIRKYGIPVVLYVTAGLVGTKRRFWFEQVRKQERLLRDIKKIPDSERRRKLEQTYGHTDTREYDSRSVMNRDELLAFLDARATIGSHTMFHPILTQCDEATGIAECKESKEALEDMLGVKVHHFALPNGNGNLTTEKWLSEANYLTCRTTIPGWNTVDTELFRLRNFGIADNASSIKAVIQATGVAVMLKKVIKVHYSLMPRFYHRDIII